MEPESIYRAVMEEAQKIPPTDFRAVEVASPLVTVSNRSDLLQEGVSLAHRMLPFVLALLAVRLMSACAINSSGIINY